MSVAVQLTGSSGHYQSIADTNILDADTAHLEQSAGLWTAGALSTDFYTFGTKSLKVSSGASTAITPSTDAAYMGVYIYSVAGDTFDINGDTGVAVPAGEWTEVTPDTGTAGTYTVNADGSADYYVGKAWLSATDAGWMPSIRIVGDQLDYRIKAKVAQSAASQDSWLGIGAQGGGSPSGFGVYQLASTGVVRCLWGNGSTLSYVGIPGSAWPDDETFELRFTFDDSESTSTDKPTVYVDGVETAFTSSANLTSWPPSYPGTSFYAGAEGRAAFELDGDIYYVEVRDGIDGPIVARMDAADWIDA